MRAFAVVLGALLFAAPALAQSAPPTDAQPDAGADTSHEDAVEGVSDGDVTEADVIEPDAEEADVIEPDAEEADVIEPDVTEAEATEAEATESDDEAAAAPEPPARAHDAELFRYDEGTSEQTVAGVLTLVGLVTGIGGVAWLVERISAVDTCADLEAREPPTMGCANVSEIRGQRDTGVGVLIGGFALGIGAGIAWAVLATTQRDAPESPAAACVGLTCVGRF